MPTVAGHRYPPVDAGGLGGRGEAARYRLAVEAAEPARSAPGAALNAARRCKPARGDADRH